MSKGYNENIKKAIEHYTRSARLSNAIEYKVGEILARVGLGFAYTEASDTKQADKQIALARGLLKDIEKGYFKENILKYMDDLSRRDLSSFKEFVEFGERFS